MALAPGTAAPLLGQLVVEPPALNGGPLAFEEAFGATDAHGRRLEARLPIHIRAPRLELAGDRPRARRVEQEILVEIVNRGDLDSDPLVARANFGGGGAAPPAFNLPALKADQSAVLAFRIDPSPPPPRGARLELTLEETGQAAWIWRPQPILIASAAKTAAAAPPREAPSA